MATKAGSETNGYKGWERNYMWFAYMTFSLLSLTFPPQSDFSYMATTAGSESTCGLHAWLCRLTANNEWRVIHGYTGVKQFVCVGAIYGYEGYESLGNEICVCVRDKTLLGFEVVAGLRLRKYCYLQELFGTAADHAFGLG